MKNFNLGVKIAEAFRVFNDEFFESGELNTNDLLCIAEHAEKIALPNLQAKQVFLTDKDADVIAARFMVRLTKDKSTDFLLMYFPESRDFDIDACSVYNKEGIQLSDNIRSFWIDCKCEEKITKKRK